MRVLFPHRRASWLPSRAAGVFKPPCSVRSPFCLLNSHAGTLNTPPDSSSLCLPATNDNRSHFCLFSLYIHTYISMPLLLSACVSLYNTVRPAGAPTPPSTSPAATHTISRGTILLPKGALQPRCVSIFGGILHMQKFGKPRDINTKRHAHSPSWSIQAPFVAAFQTPFFFFSLSL